MGDCILWWVDKNPIPKIPKYRDSTGNFAHIFG